MQIPTDPTVRTSRAARTARGLVASFVIPWLATSAVAVAETLEASAPDYTDSQLIWTPEIQMKLPEVRATAVSPDGSRVAFVVRRPIMDDTRSEYLEQIWLARADGSDLRQLTWRDESSTSPAFSPDGRTLAFLSKRPGSGSGSDDDDNSPKIQVWAMPIDGGEGREVTAAKNGVSAFAWSPSGNQIAYLAADPPSDETKQAKKEKRWVERIDQDFELTRLSLTPFDASAASPPEAKQLIDEEGVHVTDLDWSPDGSTIVIAHQADPRINTGMISGELSLIEVATGQRTPLVIWSGSDSQPHFAPDGRSIAFVSQGGSVERVGLGDVYLIDSAGDQPRALAETPDRNASIVGWTKEGEILISEALHTERALFLLKPGTDRSWRRVDLGAPVIGAPSLAIKSSAIAFSRESPETPENVFVAQLDDMASNTRGTTQLTHLHEGLELPPMGRTEKVTWRSSDGAEIEGLVTYPVGHPSGARAPLILNIHGGPAGVFSETFTGAPSIYMLQTLAQKGYAILRPNPRGSTGYGKEFRYSNVRDWCQGDYEDVIAGVDALIERGVADPERLYVMGWSYGGYMTSCVISRTQRFRAASMGAGLPNLVSMVHTTDIPDYLVAHQGGKELWQDYESYRRHSAIFRLGEITTPTQILHGAEDLRVPIGQGQELYRGLERKGVPTEMIVYPRTPHGPREPKLVMDVSGRILDWFEKFGGAEYRSESP